MSRLAEIKSKIKDLLKDKSNCNHRLHWREEYSSSDFYSNITYPKLQVELDHEDNEISISYGNTSIDGLSKEVREFLYGKNEEVIPEELKELL